MIQAEEVVWLRIRNSLLVAAIQKINNPLNTTQETDEAIRTAALLAAKP